MTAILLFAAALRAGTKEAVVAVCIPHLVATGIRFWKLRHDIDRYATTASILLDSDC